jgi:hypothetical protein
MSHGRWALAGTARGGDEGDRDDCWPSRIACLCSRLLNHPGTGVSLRWIHVHSAARRR